LTGIVVCVGIAGDKSSETYKVSMDGQVEAVVIALPDTDGGEVTESITLGVSEIGELFSPTYVVSIDGLEEGEPYLTGPMVGLLDSRSTESSSLSVTITGGLCSPTYTARMDGTTESKLIPEDVGSSRQSMGEAVGLIDGIAVSLSAGEKGEFIFVALLLGRKVGMSVSKGGPELMMIVGNPWGRYVVCCTVDTVMVGMSVGNLVGKSIASKVDTVMVGKTVGILVSIDGLELSVSVRSSIREEVGSTVGNAVGIPVTIDGLRLSVSVGIMVGRSVGKVVGSTVETIIVGKTVCISMTIDGLEVSGAVGMTV
jgi:hypothetical protein